VADVFRLGLTGGIGSGKSTVARLFAQRGAAVIDVDVISHQLTETGGLAVDAIANIFGVEVITPLGALDRAAMRQLVFSDPNAKQRLEAILHPLIEQVSTHQEQQALVRGITFLVFDVPLLVESAVWRFKVDHVLVVDCSVATQIERVMKRSAMTLSEVQAIIASQASRQERLAMADSVLVNEHLSLDELTRQVEKIMQRLGLSSQIPQLTACYLH
jgi:dephospho-CoA kinase